MMAPGTIWYTLLPCRMCISRVPVITQQLTGLHTQQHKSSKTLHVKIESTKPTDIKRDWIGPPDTDSKIRPYQYYQPKNESVNQRHFRELREEADRWNHQFWARHNKQFIQKKEDFIHRKLQEKGLSNPDGSPTKLTAEEVSVFYKQFLDENFKLHKEYNKQWYRKNISMLWPAIKVAVENVIKRRS